MMPVQFGSHFKFNVRATRFSEPPITVNEQKQIAEKVLKSLKSDIPGSQGKVSDDGETLDFVCLDKDDFLTRSRQRDGFQFHHAFIFPYSTTPPVSVPDQATLDTVTQSL